MIATAFGLGVLSITTPVVAQTAATDTVRVIANWDVAGPQSYRPVLSFALSRPL